jgi:hypothetical protein
MDKSQLDPKAFDLLVASFPSKGSEDLPDEVLNTAANITYRMCKELVQGSRVGVRSDEPFDSESWLKSATTRSRTVAEAEALPDLLDALRKMPRGTDEDIALYNYVIQNFLDEFKYRIEDCDNKTPAERDCERKLKTPDEIPELYTLLRHARELLASEPRRSDAAAKTTVIECPACGQRLRVPDKKNLRITCTKCRKIFEN